jgi:hypothetical protein
MPVFARTKLLIHDDCLAPPGPAYITLDYSGPNPQNIYKKIRELLMSIWKVGEDEIREKEVSWDRTTATEKFKVKFEVVKDMDTFSFMLITVDLEGEAKHSRQFGKEGTAKIKIESALRTEYPQDTIWQRSLLYEIFRTFYHKLIYEDTRKKYLRQCKEETLRMQEELKSFLSLLPKSY